MTSHLHPASLRTLPVVGTRRVRPHWGLGEGSGFPMRLLQLIPDLPGAEGELLCQALDICFPILNQRGLSSELKELMAVETESGSGPDIHCPLVVQSGPPTDRVLLVAHVLVVCDVSSSLLPPSTPISGSGVLLLDQEGGFWLIHSVPNFPPRASSAAYSWPPGAQKYGQTLICVSFPLTQFLDISE